MPAMKRPAAAPAKVAPAKKPKAPKDPLGNDKRVVVAALQKRKSGPDALAASVVGMLAAMLPDAVGPAPTLEAAVVPERHAFQKRIMEDIRTELGQVEEQLLAGVRAAQAACDGLQGERQSLSAAAQAAADKLLSKTEAATQAKEKFDAAAAAASEAATAHSEAVAAEQALAKALEVAEFKQEQLQKCFEQKARLETPEEAKVANDGDEARSPARSPAKRGPEATGLVRSLKGVVDASLLDAAKLSLSKKPGDRGDFDQKVLSQLEDVMRRALQELQQAADGNVAARGPRAADVAAKDAAKKARADARDDAEMAHSTEEAALEEAKAEHKAAAKALASLDEAALRDEVAARSAKVEDFRASALASYARLLQPPLPEAPAAEEAAPKADAAPAAEAEEASEEAGEMEAVGSRG